MGDICTSSTAAWKKASVSQPDLQGELYVPMFCQIDGLCPPALVILPDDSGVSDARERAYAEYFVSRGLTCLLVDPFSPMGIAGCIENPRILPLREMMAQACAAYGMLIVRRRINSVGVLGIGRGGLAAIHLGMDAVPNVPRFTGRFDFVGSPMRRPYWYVQILGRILRDWPCNGGFSLRSKKMCKLVSSYWHRYYEGKPFELDQTEDLFYTQTLPRRFREFRWAVHIAESKPAARFCFDGCLPYRPDPDVFGFHSARGFLAVVRDIKD